MLKNIFIQDSLEYTEKIREYTKNNEGNLVLDKRMGIFKKSFNAFFKSTNLKFEKVDYSLEGESKILFKKK